MRLNPRRRPADVHRVTNVRYLSWAPMILDAAAEVRAQGYASAPPDLRGGSETLANALHHRQDGVFDDAVGFLEAHPAPAARDALAAALDGQVPYRRDALRTAIAEIDVRRHAPDPRVRVPAFEPWPDTPAPAGYAERIYDVLNHAIGVKRRSIQQERRFSVERERTFDEGPDSWVGHTRRTIAALETVTMDDCAEAARAVGGSGRVHPLIRGLADIEFVRELSIPLTPIQRLRLEWDRDRPTVLMWDYDYTGVDLRHFVDAASRLGLRRPRSLITRTYFLSPPGFLAPTLAWPLFAEHPARLDDCLGLAVQEVAADEAEMTAALGVLEQMPVMPRRYLPRVGDLAVLGPSKARAAARRVVEKHADPIAVAEIGLRHGRAAVRTSAARWLVDQGARGALPSLRDALEAERSGAARSVLEEALARLDP